MKKHLLLTTLTILSIVNLLQAQETSQEKPDSVKKDLQEISIVAQRHSFKGIAKLDVPLKDLPMTLNVVSSDLLKQQGADDMISALRNVSGVRPVSTYGGFQHYVIRGFQDFVLLIDGFRDERQNISTSAPMSNLANVERIEVLKGPASVLYGHSALGGIINVVRKQPSYTPQYDFSVTYGSFNTRRITAGAGGPLSKKLRYRTDFGISEDNGWRSAGSSRATGYLALDYTSGKNEFSVQMGVSKDRYRNDAGIPIDPITHKIPAGVSLSNRYNVPEDYLGFTRIDLQAKYSREIAKGIYLTDHLAYAIDDIDYLSTESLDLTANKDSVQRGYFDFNHQTKPLQNMLDLSIDVKKWGIEQKVLIGYSVNLLDRHTYWDAALRSKYASTVSLINPQETQGPMARYHTNVKNINELMQGFYIQDFIQFTSKLKALLALRYDVFHGRYSSDVLSTATTSEQKGTVTNRNSTALTYRAGLVYQPTTQISVYGSYSTFFKPARQIAINDMVFKPETGNQLEGGLRLDLNEKISMNTSVYSILKNNMIVGLGAGKYDQASSATSQGVETDLTMEWIKGFKILAGYAYTDAKYKDYTSGVAGSGNLKGKMLQYAPKQQANLWLTYEMQQGILKGSGIAAGGYYLGDNFADSENQVLMQAYTVLNATLFYTIKTMKLSFMVNNIANQEYISSAINGTQLYPGAPRNYMVNVSCKF